MGETLKFPTTAEEVQSLLKRIGVDGIRYEEIFITSFDGDVLGLHEHLGEYESIDELNYLAALLSENFVVEQDFDTADAVLQTEEVSQIKWVSVSQLKQMAGHREFYRYPEFFDVVRFLEERRRKSGNRYNLLQQNRKPEERK